MKEDIFVSNFAPPYCLLKAFPQLLLKCKNGPTVLLKNFLLLKETETSVELYDNN